jgi:hypothetical protein
MTPLANDDKDRWQTTELDHAIAEEFFGWKWMASMCIPVRSASGYPKERMVQQFMSPQSLSSPQWQGHWEKNQGREADGTEDLAYCYCSSCGPEMVPHYSGHLSAIAELEREIRRRDLWYQYRDQLWLQVSEQTENMTIDEELLADAGCETRCVAALAVIGSKYVAAQ